MRNLLLTTLLFLLSFTCFSQQNHFIYFQSDNRQPFFIKSDNKIYSSSPSGYAILSKLTDGDYKLIIGFPKNSSPEQAFSVSVDKNDLGFVLKNFGDKGWGLFNLQSMGVIMAGEAPVKKNMVTVEHSDDPFSKMLANVVHDSTINEKEPLKEPPQKVKETEKIEDPKIPVSIEPQAANTQMSEVSKITRTSKKKNKDGYQLVYLDQSASGKDTIRVFLPIDKPEKKLPADTLSNATPVSQAQSKEAPLPAKPMQEISPDKPILKAEQVMPADTPVLKPGSILVDKSENTSAKNDSDVSRKEVEKIKRAPENKKEVVMINSDCKSLASEDDFMKLRKKMVSEKNDDDMIRVSKKTFRIKCFTTEQVKSLGSLFLKDEGKYLFFETSYPFISDSGNFGSLESQLSDVRYINRFRALIQK